MSEGRARRVDRGDWDDAQLIGAAQRGDEEAVAELYARYDPYARRVAARCTSSGASAADATAAAWASAFEKLSTLRNPERFGPWLAAIVRNCAVAGHRAQAHEVLSPALVDDVSASALVEDDTIDEDRLRRARAAVLGLSKRDRSALELSVYEQLPVAEVAAALQIDVNTAYQVLSRARRRVRKAFLTPIVGDDEPDACRACASRTPDYVLGRQQVRVAVDDHVERCARCRARLAGVLADAGRIRGPFALLFPLLLAAGRIWRWPGRAFGSLRGRTQVQIGAAAAAMILLAGLLGGITLASSSGRTHSPVSIAPASQAPTPARHKQPVKASGSRSASPAHSVTAPTAAPASRPTSAPTTHPHSPPATRPLVPAPTAPTTAARRSRPTTARPTTPSTSTAPTTSTTTAPTISTTTVPRTPTTTPTSSPTTPTPPTTTPGHRHGHRSPKPGRRVGPSLGLNLSVGQLILGVTANGGQVGLSVGIPG